MLNILMILPEPVYPPESGPHYLSFGFLRHISRQNKCHVVGFAETRSDGERWLALEKKLPNVQVVKIVGRSRGPRRTLSRLSRFARGKPVSFASFENPELRLWLKRNVEAAKYDIIHFDSFNVSIYRDECENVPSVLVPYDAFSMGAWRAMRTVKRPAARLRYFWKWWTYSRFERSEYRHFTKVCPVSDIDTEWLTRLDPSIDAQTVGIPLSDDFLVDLEEAGSERRIPHVICCGSLREDAIAEGTAEFVKEIYPRIVDDFPYSRVTVWGSHPTSLLRKLLKKTPGIQHVGHVDDYIDFLRSATVYVFPQRSGSGIQTKVQQAMAVGIPVVARTSAIQALGAEINRHAFACDDNSSMSDCILRLMSDVELRTRMGQAGAKYVRQTYELSRIGSQLEKIYLTAIKKHSEGRSKRLPSFVVNR